MPILNELKMKGKCVIWTWPEEGLHMSEGLLNIRLKKINKSFFFLVYQSIDLVLYGLRLSLEATHLNSQRN